MTNKLWLTFTLESEASFSRGDGVPGVVDVELNHDRYGLPFLGGRTLKGLLHAEATEIVDALHRADQVSFSRWAAVANRLFGQPGSLREKQGILHVGDAQLPADLRSQVAHNFHALNLQRQEVLESLTTIRRQTAVEYETGAPEEDTLRAVRVVIRGITFAAPLLFRKTAESDDLAFLAACVRAFRRAGSNKTRGYGRLQSELQESLDGPTVTDAHFRHFKEALR